VGDLFGVSGRWEPALVTDAAFAVAAASRAIEGGGQKTSGDAWIRRLRAGTGVVTAATAATACGHIFLGFERGEVVCFRPDRNEVVPVASFNLPVASLAVDPEGDELVVLRSNPTGRGILSAYAKQADGSYQTRLGMSVDRLDRPWLTPVFPVDNEPLFGFWDGSLLHLLATRSLTSIGSIALPGSPETIPTVGLLAGAGEMDDLPSSVLMHDGWQWSLIKAPGRVMLKTGLTWLPAALPDSTLRAAPLCRSGDPSGVLDLAGLDGQGVVHWARLQEGQVIARNSAAISGGYLAATIVRDDLVAAVATRRVEWLRCGANRFTTWRSTEAPLAGAVACFAVRQTRELVVVGRDGDLTQLEIPRR
jgi:hypothetical protein